MKTLVDATGHVLAGLFLALFTVWCLALLSLPILGALALLRVVSQ